MSQRHGLSALALLIALLLPQISVAKDLTNRLGVGYKNQFSIDLPSVAAQYYPSPDFGVAAALGVDTQKYNSRFGFMVKLMRIIFTEDNLNFYMGAGGGIVTVEEQATATTSNTQSGFELMALTGAEFFLPGLESLGVSFETGVGITSLSDGVRFRTIADHPLRAGITFYF